jgi:hypothetical protein
MEERMDINSLKRRFTIGLSANGVVFVRDREAATSDEKREAVEFSEYALPVYSTDTRQEADDIIIRKCPLGYEGRYLWPNFSGNVDDLDLVSREMATIHKWQQARKKRTATESSSP